jgi:hypothetical protein
VQVALHTGQPLGTHHQEAGGADRERGQEPLERSIQEQGEVRQAAGREGAGA